MGSISGFKVVVKQKEVVAAVLPMQEHWLPMSNLDLLLPPLDVGVFFCYKKKVTQTNIKTKTKAIEEEEEEECSVMILKKALAEALVSFYALGGEVVENCVGEPELLCNNRGVDFIHAYADVELRNLDLYHPYASVHGKLIPLKNQGVLCIQVTELKCGGLVIGCTFDHRVADAHSANMFFVAWAEIAHGKPISHVPSFRRSLITPRRPGHYDSSIDNMYVFISSLPPPKVVDLEPTEDSLQSRIYYVVAEELNRLQSQATSSNGIKRSKLVSFSAFLWKLIASAASESEFESDPNNRCKMGVVVDGRERLMDTTSIPLQKYFGNVLSVPYGEASVGKLKAMPVSEVAGLVYSCLNGAANEEHFLGLIDWVEFHRPEKAIVRVYCKESKDETAVVVSSGQRFPVSEIDFGWGKPAFGSYHFPWGGQTGYVMPMPSISRDGDWIVYMHLHEKHLDFVESQAGHMFRPLTAAYLNLKA